METVGLMCFRRSRTPMPAAEFMAVSTRTKTGSTLRKMRKASWSVVATVTSKFLRDRCEARYLAIAASSSTIRTRVLSFMPVSWIWPEKVGLDKSAAGPNLALLIVLRFHFQVFGCLHGKLAQGIASIAGIDKVVRLKGRFTFRRLWQSWQFVQF